MTAPHPLPEPGAGRGCVLWGAAGLVVWFVAGAVLLQWPALLWPAVIVVGLVMLAFLLEWADRR